MGGENLRRKAPIYANIYALINPFRKATPVNKNDDSLVYHVVRNHEEQFSIWPALKELPLGWVNAGKSGSMSECLEHIGSVWTDMRPLSLQLRMDAVSTSANCAGK